METSWNRSYITSDDGVQRMAVKQQWTTTKNIFSPCFGKYINKKEFQKKTVVVRYTNTAYAGVYTHIDYFHSSHAIVGNTYLFIFSFKLYFKWLIVENRASPWSFQSLSQFYRVKIITGVPFDKRDPPNRTRQLVKSIRLRWYSYNKYFQNILYMFF